MYHHVRPFHQTPPPPVKTLAKMDPDCAICHAPATMACDCEANSLEVAIRQAEARVMQSAFNEIRAWVRAHAQDHILEHFRIISERRKLAHTEHIDRITEHAYHFFGKPPHPSEIAAAQTALRHSINDDWQSSVMRYPEVLHYYYNLVEWTVPPDDDRAMRHLPLPAMRGQRPPGDKRRGSGGGGGAPTIASTSADFGGRRTPSGAFAPRGPGDRRTPGPGDRRSYGRPPPPPQHPAGGYFGQPPYFA